MDFAIDFNPDTSESSAENVSEEDTDLSLDIDNIVELKDALIAPSRCTQIKEMM